jgi:HAD superfamily hydrolase (TIGR01509 family)
MTDRPTLVIFDCDGVLVDSEPASNAVLAACLTAVGLPTSAADALEEYRGRLMADVVARAEAHLGAPLPEGFVADYEAARIDAFRRDLSPIPGVADAVRSISAAGIRVCVASQGKLEKTELTLSLTGLRGLFADDALFSAYAVARGKPHPDLFLHAAASMGAAAADTAVVEDTAIGATAGVAAGMRVLGYAPTDADGAALTAAGAEPFAAFAELPGLLGV